MSGTDTTSTRSTTGRGGTSGEFEYPVFPGGLTMRFRSNRYDDRDRRDRDRGERDRGRKYE